MSLEWALIVALATGLLCGWLARWQFDRKNWEPDDDWSDVYDRWDRS